MSFPFYIARRHLFSKKSTHAINIISAISATGVAVATMALVVTLSVFNGFHDLVESFFTQFDPQIKIIPTQGKTVQIRQLPQIEIATETVEDQALAVFNDKQAMIHLKGVDDNFEQLTHIDEILLGDGEFELHAANLQYGILGIRLAQTLGTGARFRGFLRIYAPKREGQIDMTNPNDAFVEDSLMSPGVIFHVKQAKYDGDYIIAPIAFARNLFDQQGMLSSLELRVRDDANINQVKKQIKQIAGTKYQVLDRYEQQAETFNIMNIEKMIAYIFLTFILTVAAFNIIGSLTMLIIDKKEDVNTLRNLGATEKQVAHIFTLEGMIISIAGALIGTVLALLLCYLQQRYSLVTLGQSEGSFVVNAYPVSVHASDILLTLITVTIISYLSVRYPVRYLSKRFL